MVVRDAPKANLWSLRVLIANLRLPPERCEVGAEAAVRAIISGEQRAVLGGWVGRFAGLA